MSLARQFPNPIHLRSPSGAKTYQESKEVEDEGKVELDLAPDVVLPEPPRVLIHQLPFAEAAPVASHLPDRRQHGWQRDVVKDVL